MIRTLFVLVVTTQLISDACATRFWLSTSGDTATGFSSAASEINIHPVSRPIGSIFIWARPDAGKTLANWSLNLSSQSSDSSGMSLENNVLTFTGSSVEAFNRLEESGSTVLWEYVGEPIGDEQGIAGIQGFTLLQQARTGLGIGAASMGMPLSDERYDSDNDAWLIAQVDYAPTSVLGIAELELVEGANGLNNLVGLTQGGFPVFSSTNANFIGPVALHITDADFDGDRDADGLDFLTWQRTFDNPFGQFIGDANEDSDVNNFDLRAWQEQYGELKPALLGIAVPEPSTITLFVLALGLVGKNFTQSRLMRSEYRRCLCYRIAQTSSFRTQQRGLRSCLIVCMIFLGLFYKPNTADAVTDWIKNGDGNWGAGALNWSGGVPGPGETARFLASNIDKNITVNLNNDRDVGRIIVSQPGHTTIFYGNSASNRLRLASELVVEPGSGRLILNSSVSVLAPQVWRAQRDGGGNDILIQAGRTLDLNAHALTINGSGNTSFQSNIIGAGGSIIKRGEGILLLSGTNTYSGTTNIENGIMQLGTSSGILDSTDVSVSSGAIFDINGFSETIDALSGSGSVTLGSGAIGIGAGGGSSTFSGVISGSGGMQKKGSGTLVLSGANTYSGITVVSGGTLQLGASGVISDLSDVTINGGTVLNINGFSETIDTLSGSGSVTLGSGAIGIGAGGGSSTFSGVISGSGGMQKKGSGTLVLSGANEYFGGTRLEGGTLQISSDSNLGMPTSPIVFKGGRLATSSNMTLPNSRTLDISTHDARFAPAFGTSMTYSGVISGNSGVRHDGRGTLILSGNNTYSAGTSIESGVLRIGSNSNLGLTSSPVILGGHLQATQSFTLPDSRPLEASGGAIDTNGFQVSVEGAISGSQSFHKRGAGTLILSGINDYEGHTEVKGGTLAITGEQSFGSSSQFGGTHPILIDSGALLDISDIASLLNSDLTINSSGTVITGDLSLGTSAALRGDFSLQGDLVNNGTVAPGLANLSGFGEEHGEIELQGTYTQGTSGILEIKIEGTNQHDQLEVSGTVSLDGTLQLKVPSNFRPDLNDTVTILSGSEITGSFDDYLIEIPGGFKLIDGDEEKDAFAAVEIFEDRVDVRFIEGNGLRNTAELNPGDMDRNGPVELNDIEFFAMALRNPDEYLSAVFDLHDGEIFPNAPAQVGSWELLEGDVVIRGDDEFNFDDIPGFLKILSDNGISPTLAAAVLDAHLQGVPEPYSLTLSCSCILIWAISSRSNRR